MNKQAKTKRVAGFKVFFCSVFSKDPKASYDVNDGDPDPQPRYTQLNDNRYRSPLKKISTLVICSSVEPSNSGAGEMSGIFPTC